MHAPALRRVAVVGAVALAFVATTVIAVQQRCHSTFGYMVGIETDNQEDWRRDAVVLVDGQERFVTEDHAAWDFSLSPDGERVVVAKAAGGTDSEYDSAELTGLFIYDIDGSNEVELGAIGSSPDWSPDGREIAFMTGRLVKAVSIEDKEQREVYRLPPSDAVDPPYLIDTAWSADANEIAVAVGHNNGATIWTMGADGSRPTRSMEADGLLGDLQWSPDGAFAWSGQYKGVFSVLVAEPSGEIMQVEPNSGSPVWSNDGTQMAYVIGHEGHYEPRIVVGDERGQGEEAIPLPDGIQDGKSLMDWASC